MTREEAIVRGIFGFSHFRTEILQTIIKGFSRGKIRLTSTTRPEDYEVTAWLEACENRIFDAVRREVDRRLSVANDPAQKAEQQ